jgi:hypothetical protein
VAEGRDLDDVVCSRRIAGCAVGEFALERLDGAAVGHGHREGDLAGCAALVVLNADAILADRRGTRRPEDVLAVCGAGLTTRPGVEVELAARHRSRALIEDLVSARLDHVKVEVVQAIEGQGQFHVSGAAMHERDLDLLSRARVTRGIEQGHAQHQGALVRVPRHLDADVVDPVPVGVGAGHRVVPFVPFEPHQEDRRIDRR